MKLRNDPGEERNAEHAPYPEAEIEFVRQRLRLPHDEPIGPWIEYCRSWSAWREKCNCLLMWIMTNPPIYLRNLAALYRKRHGQDPSQGWKLQHAEAVDELAAQLMEYARPGQGSISLTLEILGQQVGQPRCNAVIKELIAGRWLPKAPLRPSETRREREQAERAHRSGITHEQRQVNATALAATF
jgi:urease gamma subunit